VPRTAVFGGSFNPIHYGHLLLADDLLEILTLDRVLFVPAKHPPHNDPSRLAAPEERLAMVRLATEGHRGFEVSDMELARPGPSFTVDTLAALARPGQALFLVVGSETFLDLLAWRDPRRGRVREGRSLAFRLPPVVADYIRARGLYREPPA
jgi:nicotinate-nucleotide adenylyltransferase